MGSEFQKRRHSRVSIDIKLKKLQKWWYEQYQKLAGFHRGGKLTKRSRTDVNPEEAEALSVSRMRPSLLSHREPQVHLTTILVTGLTNQIQVTAE